METIDKIEWGLIIGVALFYFLIPLIVKGIMDFEKKARVFKVMNFVYLLFSIALIGEVVYQFIAYDILDSGYKLSRVGLVFITIVMYCYTAFFKKKQLLEN